jgi:hypothetical protein
MFYRHGNQLTLYKMYAGLSWWAHLVKITIGWCGLMSVYELDSSGMDLSFIVRKIMIPIFLYLLDRLIVPYFFARTLGLCLTQSYTLRTLIMRYSFVVYYVSRLIVVGIRFAREYVGRMHTEILDSRYLVGTELTNRQ